MTNHSSSAYQVVIIAVRKEDRLEEILKNYASDFELLDESDIEEIGNDYNIEIEHLTDEYDIYRYSDYSADEHGFVEGEVDTEKYEDIMDYWNDWVSEAEQRINEIYRQGKGRIKILYEDQDYT